MKNTVLVLITASSLLFACNNSSSDQSSVENKTESKEKSKVKTALMTFENSKYDFGTVTEGDKVVHEFKFTNEGTQPLIISSASATCGCTVPEYPKAPVAPGESGVIKVVFNTEGKVGMQHKVVTINSNDYYATSEVYLTGEVKAKAGAAKPAAAEPKG
jgi:hypothetical protein